MLTKRRPLPPELRLFGEVRKHVLREAVRDLFPGGVLDATKRGFSFPMGAWMRRGPLRDVILRALSPEAVRRRGLFRVDAVARLCDDFARSTDGDATAGLLEVRVWTLVMLELWCRMFIDDDAPRSPDVSLDELLPS